MVNSVLGQNGRHGQNGELRFKMVCDQYVTMDKMVLDKMVADKFGHLKKWHGQNVTMTKC